jgi:signal transduction histidine kinase
MAAEKVEMMLRVAEDSFLARLQLQLATGDASEAALDRIVESARLVRRLYVFERDGSLLYPRTWRDPSDATLFGETLRPRRQAVWEHGGKREVVAGGQVCLAVLLRPRREPVLVAYARDTDALRRDILATSLAALESPTVIAVLDSDGRAVYARSPLEKAEPVLAIPMREGLPDWRVAVYAPPGASPHDMVRRQVMLFTAAFGVLVAVIVAGVVLTWRLTRRETEMAQLKADFVANVSHDLKTPLSVIRMFGETLEMGRVPDASRRQEYYRIITHESERLSHLIDNVLDFSRIEGGRRRYDLAPTAVEPLIRETLDAFAYPLEQGGFKVEVTAAPDLPETPMDAEAIGQALGNLLDNAIKYSDTDRIIGVDARREGEGLALSVSDRGVGIAPDEHARIFEKFYRVGHSETQGRRGSGVGLALVRHVAEAHGGRVIVESVPGSGSRFTIRIPISKESP